MTKDQKRIAIAEACGWKKVSEGTVVVYTEMQKTQGAMAVCKTCNYAHKFGLFLDDAENCGHEWKLWYDQWFLGDIWVPVGGLPNFCGSLDAMHEAEKVFEAMPYVDGWKEYFINLIKVTGNTYIDGKLLITATAAQRAEAFLRTLNLWTE